MEIKSLSKIEFGTIFKAFNQAFADYEVQINELQLKIMLKRRGFNPDLSFAAFDGHEIVAFTLNGTGNFNGIPTAYDTGTGTLKGYRGKGLALLLCEAVRINKNDTIKAVNTEIRCDSITGFLEAKNIQKQLLRNINCRIQFVYWKMMNVAVLYQALVTL